MQPIKNSAPQKVKIVSKSRRSKGVARDLTEDVHKTDGEKPPEPEYMPYGEYLFMVA